MAPVSASRLPRFQRPTRCRVHRRLFPRASSFHAFRGKAVEFLRLEQTPFQTLYTWRTLDSQRRKLHFWRDRSGHEVDFILEEAGKLVALEIKAVRLVTTGDLIGIRAFRDALKHKGSRVGGVVLHSGKSRPLGADDIALSWRWILPEPR
jgi:predicted AAA+ superfamily ATPase